MLGFQQHARLKSIGKYLKREINVYRLVLKDSRTPKLAKFLLVFALGFTPFPFAVIVVPVLIFIALRMIPKEVINENRAKSITEMTDDQADPTAER